MRKYFFYEDYKAEVTNGFDYVGDLGDYDLYINDTDARLIYRENIDGWQDGRFKEKWYTRRKKDKETFLASIDAFKDAEENAETFDERLEAASWIIEQF